MGYSERFCQLCGISFRIGRIRTRDEPFEAAWDYSGYGAVETDMCGCEAEGCEDIERTLPEHVYHDGSVRAPEQISEHIAGPACTSTSGYSGHRISLEEMSECKRVQCLMSKDEDWSPEQTDEDFECAAKYSWLTGISEGPADEFEVNSLVPIRHGVSDTCISNCNDCDSDWGMPMHPVCFQMFKRMSLERFGKVAIDDLRLLWLEHGEHCARFAVSRGPADVALVTEQFHESIPGTEYLAANPLRIPQLDGLIQSCLVEGSGASDVVFDTSGPGSSDNDLFATLSPELKAMIMGLLGRQDLASLRLGSRSFEQIPQTYFRRLVANEMPWIWWDIEDLSPKQVDWHKLWCRLSAADGGSQVDETERILRRSVEYHQYEQALAKLRAEDREQVGDKQPNHKGIYVYTEEQKAKIKAIVEERMKAEKARPKPTEVKGLRNRRRIYGDINEILDAIAELDGRRMSAEWSINTAEP